MTDAALLVEARVELERYLPWQVRPALSVDDLDKLLAANLICTTWVAETEYEVGDIVRPTNDLRNGLRYICTVAGESDDTEPTWTQGAMNDGDDIVWVPYGPDPRQIYDVRKAIHQGWLMKAGQASSYAVTNVLEGGTSYHQIYDHCIQMAAKYAPIEIG